MEVGVERRGNVKVIAVRGCIGHLNASTFHEQLIPHLQECRSEGDAIVLDLSGLDYISSFVRADRRGHYLPQQ